VAVAPRRQMDTFFLCFPSLPFPLPRHPQPKGPTTKTYLGCFFSPPHGFFPPLFLLGFMAKEGHGKGKWRPRAKICHHCFTIRVPMPSPLTQSRAFLRILAPWPISGQASSEEGPLLVSPAMTSSRNGSTG
jgi:hypothetical protein